MQFAEQSFEADPLALAQLPPASLKLKKEKEAISLKLIEASEAVEVGWIERCAVYVEVWSHPCFDLLESVDLAGFVELLIPECHCVPRAKKKRLALGR